MANNPFNIVLLGPPGAGKGTQAAHLIKAYKLLHISTGDMLRSAIKEGSDVGKEAQKYINKGELVPDDIVTQAVIARMSKDDAQGGVILDGYPRTCIQAESLNEALKRTARSLKCVLFFKTSEDVAIQRLSGRRVCPKCGKNYHITNMPPKKDGFCDSCVVALIQREDDSVNTVKNRLKVYEDQTKDLISFYRDEGLLREVNGDIPAVELFEHVDNLFRSEGWVV
ncbi:MAG: adenylate kinase [Candidatus Omnitrophota bacterium]|nr:adenylate kinase [Pseudomonadota bacterium]